MSRAIERVCQRQDYIRIFRSYIGIGVQSRRPPYAVILCGTEYIMCHQTELQTVLCKRLTECKVKIEICIFPTLTQDTRADKVRIELQLGRLSYIEIIDHGKGIAQDRSIRAPVESAVELIMEYASVHHHSPPMDRFDDSTCLEAHRPVISGIYQRVQSDSGFRFISKTDALTHITSLAIKSRYRQL